MADVGPTLPDGGDPIARGNLRTDGDPPGAKVPAASRNKDWDDEVVRETFARSANYQIESKLGEGGMGAVYKARQLTLDRKVAIKILPRHLCEDATYASRLYREGQVLAKLNHPNIITCYDLGEQNGMLYVVMEFVEGRTLSALIDERKHLDLREALHYLKQAVLGLDHANAQGIIHRDIKPDNMLLAKLSAKETTTKVSAGYSLKIADMGLAAISEEGGDATRLTMAGATVGTPQFMSPEQTLGEEDLDFRTDIYALGITLYNMLTREVPYNFSNIGVILARKLNENFRDCRELCPDLPAPVSVLIQRMTARKKENRYASYGELLQDIEALEAGKEIHTGYLAENEASMNLTESTLELLKRGGGTRVDSSAAPEFTKTVQMKVSRQGRGFPAIRLLVVAAAILIVALAAAFVTAPPTDQGSPSGGSPSATGDAKAEPKAGAPISAAEPEVFESFDLVDKNAKDLTRDWKVYNEGLERTSFQITEEGALAISCMSSSFLVVEKDCSRQQIKVTATLQAPDFVDNLELRIPTGAQTYLAVGFSQTPEGEGDDLKVTGYCSLRGTSSDQELKACGSTDLGEAGRRYDVTVRVWDGHVKVEVDGKKLHEQAFDEGFHFDKKIRLAAKGGTGYIQGILISPNLESR